MQPLGKQKIRFPFPLQSPEKCGKIYQFVCNLPYLEVFMNIHTPT